MKNNNVSERGTTFMVHEWQTALGNKIKNEDLILLEDYSFSDSLKKLDSELTKKIEESAKKIEQNKNDSLDQVQTQIKEISKISISKITNFKISDDQINEALSNQKDLN